MLHASDSPPMIRVEFYGVARQRAKAASVEVAGRNLDDVLGELKRRFPAWAEACLANGELHPAFAANINGRRFVRDVNTPLERGDCLLILSADAGG